MSKYYGMCLTTYRDPAYSNGRRKCTGRRMLTKRPEEYVIPPRCPHCGDRRWYLDRQIVRRHAAERCNCGGLHFRIVAARGIATTVRPPRPITLAATATVDNSVNLSDTART